MENQMTSFVEGGMQHGSLKNVVQKKSHKKQAYSNVCILCGTKMSKVLQLLVAKKLQGCQRICALSGIISFGLMNSLEASKIPLCSDLSDPAPQSQGGCICRNMASVAVAVAFHLNVAHKVGPDGARGCESRAADGGQGGTRRSPHSQASRPGTSALPPRVPPCRGCKRLRRCTSAAPCCRPQPLGSSLLSVCPNACPPPFADLPGAGSGFDMNWGGYSPP